MRFIDSAYIRAVLIWVLFIPFPIINGFLREKVYRDLVGESAARQISTVIISLVFFIYAWLLMRGILESASNKKLLILGAIWVGLTIGFEFGVGYFFEGFSWEVLFADYDITKGRIWGLFLVLLFFTPLIIKRTQKVDS